MGRVLRERRKTAFLATLMMAFSIVLVAPAAHAKEKEAQAATDPRSVTQQTKPPVTTDPVAEKDETTAVATDGRLAEPSEQKAANSTTPRTEIKGSPVAPSKSTAATSKKTAPARATTSTGKGSSKRSSAAGQTTSPNAGNPNAGCYSLPANSDTGRGANTRGVYDSTCDGTASQNGSGTGSAVGRPCAGCVGKADYKNPKGQMPNARLDGNRGYECDNNQGIGKTNPAHTGCKSGAVNPPPDTSKPPVHRPPDQGKPPVNQPPPGKPPVEEPPRPGREEKPSAPDRVLPRPPLERDVLRPAPEPQPVIVPLSPGALPVTGTDAWLFLLLGCGLIGSGWMALLSLPIRGRRSSTV